MNANAVARHYAELTAEERFRLILAAGARGDDAEQDRLKAAGERITLSMPDHSPYGHAFDELALLIFIELLDLAANFLEALQHSDGPVDVGDDEADDDETDGDEADDDETDDGDPDDDEAGDDESQPAAGDHWKKPTWQRFLDLALAVGYRLKTKGDAWKLFCEQMTVPPYAVWESLPGCDRLKRALDVAEQVAFTAEGMVRWLNSIRTEGEPEVAELAETPDRCAAALETIFRTRVSWWGGAALP